MWSRALKFDFIFLRPCYYYWVHDAHDEKGHEQNNPKN